MDHTIEKLQKLHSSVQRLETVLQEVWSLVDEIGEDEAFKELKKKGKQYKSKKQVTGENLEDLSAKLDEYESLLEEIPEDGTAAVDLEDVISELIEWINNNK